VRIGAKNVLPASEGADQHEQSGLRQVEVGEHRLDDFEFEARVNEDIRFGT
jgi:hypothetical protein